MQVLKRSTLLIFMLVAYALSGNLSGCNTNDSGSPTSSSLVPTYPLWETSPDNQNQINFWSEKGKEEFAVSLDSNGEFRLNIPAGEYLVTYSTRYGTFRLVLHASENVILHIGLSEGDAVSQLSIQKGKISQDSSNVQQHGTVTLYAWPGSDSPDWQETFSAGSHSSPIILVDKGQIATEISIIPKPNPSTPSIAPKPPINTTNPQCEKRSKTLELLRRIASALGSYQVDMNTFPIALDEGPLHEGLLPLFYYDGPYHDEWGAALQYQSDGSNYSLKSYGSDAREGEDDDIFTQDLLFADGAMGSPIFIDGCPPEDPADTQKRTIATMRAIATAIGSYDVDWNHYPLALEERNFSIELFENPTYEYYRGTVKDGWGTPFKYISDGTSYRLTSYGQDQREGDGGGEFDVDIFFQDGALFP